MIQTHIFTFMTQIVISFKILLVGVTGKPVFTSQKFLMNQRSKSELKYQELNSNP